MKLIINGQEKTVADDLKLSALLQSLGLADRPVVVELNAQALPPSAFEDQELKDGDRLEIVTIAAGG